MAEGARFELADGFPSPVFKSAEECEAGQLQPTSAESIDLSDVRKSVRLGSVTLEFTDRTRTGRVADLRRGLCLVGEMQQVEVGVRRHHVVGLAADPPAHVHRLWHEGT